MVLISRKGFRSPNSRMAACWLAIAAARRFCWFAAGDEIFAVGAHCSHYHGPLADGLVVNGTVRCPWHHAAFDLRTGEAVRAPALSPIGVLVRGTARRQGLRAREADAAETEPLGVPSGKAPDRIVIVGGGAAGFAAAEMLRRRAYQGSIVMLSSEAAPPVDRPNLSKDYLAGTAPEEWVPLRPDSFYAENGIDLRLSETVAGIEHAIRAKSRSAMGENVPYDRLLLATGAEPIRCRSPASTSRMFTPCARWPTAEPSSNAPRPRAGPS